MRNTTTEEVRNKFISYFVNKNHTYVPASPLIPHNDPSLMFVNSGMVQFKGVFTGQEERDYTRAVSSQKSLRAGGKHNDLDNVGYTARHHTFFEMLGNFSFGDYFKEEAIHHAWNLLTKEFGIPKSKLYATVYHTDDEAASFWKKIAGFEDSKIIKIKTNDNFWSMGDTGPCGPCSEIFYDHGDHIPGGLPGTPEQDGDRFIEIWNMVFMQFEQIDKDTKIELPKKSIDTGMGLERIAAVLQGVHDNYDIDLFKEIIGHAESILKVKDQDEARFSYRVIADHLRSCSFLIADGVMPSNEGRGYVLRRIMRRAMRHAHQLGTKDPLMYRLLPKLIELMGAAYPELKRAEDMLSEILKQEEIRFKTTLDRGLKLLDDETAHLTEGSELSGKVAFKLYDTYGFPLDLTEDILKKKQILVDTAGFNDQMLEQKDRARKSWVGSGETKVDNIWFNIKNEFGSTEFLGYTFDTLEAKILALVQDNNSVDEISNQGDKFLLVSNQTPFYGESGGQMGDIGIIESERAKVKVVDTLKYLGGLHVHVCILDEGSIRLGEDVKLHINLRHRKNLKSHHSATHILHTVLKERLGKHITQKGSFVAPDRLRFDFNHPTSLSLQEIHSIEDKVNQIITDNSKVDTALMSTDEAIASGATALFGEKYDLEVRVVSMGSYQADGSAYSFELCGGTHVARTGDIGAFKIVSESAIAAGVRRIEAVCGEFAGKIARENEALLVELADILKSTRFELPVKVNSLMIARKELEKELNALKAAELNLNSDIISKEAVSFNRGRFIYRLVENIDPKTLRAAAEQLSLKDNTLIVVFVSKILDKLSITVALHKNISIKFNAADIAKKLSHFLGGAGGGGAPTLAQAGGIEISKLTQLPHIIKEIVEN
jgi:alanyl-tRNA synthetase